MSGGLLAPRRVTQQGPYMAPQGWGELCPALGVAAVGCGGADIPAGGHPCGCHPVGARDGVGGGPRWGMYPVGVPVFRAPLGGVPAAGCTRVGIPRLRDVAGGVPTAGHPEPQPGAAGTGLTATAHAPRPRPPRVRWPPAGRGQVGGAWRRARRTHPEAAPGAERVPVRRRPR